MKNSRIFFYITLTCLVCHLNKVIAYLVSKNLENISSNSIYFHWFHFPFVRVMENLKNDTLFQDETISLFY